MNANMPPDYHRTVMPEAFSQADAEWIQEQMVKLSPAMRHRIALKYTEVYQQAFDSEEVSFRQQNRARHEANTRLRLFVDRYHKAAMGLAEKPALASAQGLGGAASVPAGQQQAAGWL